MKRIALLLAAALLALFAAASLAEGQEGMPNPWLDVTEEELVREMGKVFAVPEGAEDPAYRYLPAQKLAEMHFILDGRAYCARAKATEDWEDISGMYYDWENEFDEAVGESPAKYCVATDGDATVEVCLWRMADSGLMYSLSVSEIDLYGVDLTKLALQVLP